MKSDLSGTISLVTGAARGIGQAIADRFAASGSTVYYTDIDGPEAVAAAARFPSCRAATLNVTDGEAVRALVARIQRECGRLDIVVNNAGRQHAQGSRHDRAVLAATNGIACSMSISTACSKSVGRPLRS